MCLGFVSTRFWFAVDTRIRFAVSTIEHLEEGPDARCEFGFGCYSEGWFANNIVRVNPQGHFYHKVIEVEPY